MANFIGIEAAYIGPPVMLYESFRQSDIQVTAIYDDSSYNCILPNSSIIVSTLVMDTKPMQMCTVKYIDPNTRIPYTATVEVPAIYPIKLTANYTGDYIYIIGDFNHDDIDVYIEYNFPEYNTKLSPAEYKISSYTVETLGPNEFTVTEKILKTNNISGTITVYGIRNIIEIRAQYIGNPIEITDEVNPENIFVEIETLDEFNENKFTVPLKYGTEILKVGNDEFTCDFYINEPLTVNVVGDNIFTLHYKDPLVEWEKKISVPGIPKAIELKTNYVGNRLKEGDIVNPDDVEALVTFLINLTTNTKVTETVAYGEWEFYDAPIVQDFNGGTIRVQYRSLTANLAVPYDPIETIRLRCWYEGAKIEVGERFSRDNVFAYVVDEDSRVRALSQYDLVFVDDLIIYQDGWNFYRIRVKDSEKRIEGTYAVPGFLPLYKTEKRPFKVIYVDIENDYQEIDCTKRFQDAMTMEDVLYINWDVFQEVVDDTTRYGLYILTAPRSCGLSNKYDEDWEVLCLHKHTLKANIIKTYHKEEESWQDRRHQQQSLKRWWKIPLQ